MRLTLFVEDCQDQTEVLGNKPGTIAHADATGGARHEHRDSNAPKIKFRYPQRPATFSPARLAAAQSALLRRRNTHECRLVGCLSRSTAAPKNGSRRSCQRIRVKVCYCHFSLFYMSFRVDKGRYNKNISIYRTLNTRPPRTNRLQKQVYRSMIAYSSATMNDRSGKTSMTVLGTVRKT